MRIPRWAAVTILAMVAVPSCCFAQQKFPLRPGEWALTSPDGGSDPMMFCLNDEMWQKALTRNPVCTIQELKITSGGITYFMNCPTKSFQMKGSVTLTFDGMEHMTGKALLDTTVNGKTTTGSSLTDYRWRNSKCGPNDINLHTGAGK
jgi:Protein of unknown function (DUF3617)